jgi:stress response protein SCP2
MPTVNLQKGAKVNLTKGKGADNVNRIRVGLKWQSDCDVDASILMLDGNKKKRDLVYFGQKKSRDGSIIHMGDDTTGHDIKGADGDNENIDITLDKAALDVQEMLILANIYDAARKGQTFANIGSVRIRVTNLDTNEIMAVYDLEGKSSVNAAEVARIYRRGDGWNLEAVGNDMNLRVGKLGEMTAKYE